MGTNPTRFVAAAMAMVAALAGADRATASETVRPTAATSTPRRLVVSIPDRKLVVIENEKVVSVFQVAVGAASTPSPIGTFTIVNRIPNPTYYRPGKVVGPGAANPLGTRWIGLSEKGYGIHGTDSPRSIGYAKSHGCIRLRNADVERLFERVRAGDVVELHAERTPDIAPFFNGR
jgi:lipoprotein-anchoring transpeptidase ErfK/SrfK